MVQLNEATTSEEIPICQYTDGINLNLADSGIRQVNKLFVSSSQVVCLNLKNNEINKIDSRAFDELPNIRYLNLANNYIDYKSYMMTSEYQSVETLVLDEAFLITLDHNTRENCRYYRSCSQYTDKQIEMSIRAPLLKNLYLRYNNITTLKIQSWADNMPNLTYLYLSHNKLKTVDFLKYIPSTLTHLFLDNNEITRLVSKSLHNLKELKMDNNNISTLCGTDNYCESGMYLKNGINIENLSLSNVSLSTIDPDALEDLHALKNFNLSSNNIHKISKHTFDNLTNLINLDLRSNELLAVPDICALQKLNILLLNNNNIIRIDDRFACNISSLEVLSLNQNKINYIGSGAFHGLPSLKALGLSGNQLEVLTDNWILAENSLQVLYLNDNLFSSIASMTLDNCTGLESVNIAGNPLKTLSLKSLMNLPENTVIDLNQLKTPEVPVCGCDCNAYQQRYGYL